MQLTPDLKQNIFYMTYFIVKHNLSAIIYGTGILFSIILAVIKPSRKAILILLGFIILLFAFEYNKHIAEPLHKQTIESLITLKRYYKLEWIIQVVLTKVLPILLPAIGWCFVGVSAFLFIFKKRK